MSNKYYKQNRQNFLLTFFDDKSEFQQKEINGFWLVKQWNGNTKVWQVAIYSQESFKKKQDYLKSQERQEKLI